MANTETEPIKDTKKVALFLDVLKVKNEICYVVAKVQVNTGLRISDVIPLACSDLFDKSDRWKQHHVKRKLFAKPGSLRLRR